MTYATDILFRRSLIVAGFRVARAKDRLSMFKKLSKSHEPETLKCAVGCASVAKGNCVAAMEDDVDAQLSKAFGWETISSIRAESIERLKKRNAHLLKKPVDRGSFPGL